MVDFRGLFGSLRAWAAAFRFEAMVIFGPCLGRWDLPSNLNFLFSAQISKNYFDVEAWKLEKY
jgi:hypothetical protein